MISKISCCKSGGPVKLQESIQALSCEICAIYELLLVVRPNIGDNLAYTVHYIRFTLSTPRYIRECSPLYKENPEISPVL